MMHTLRRPGFTLVELLVSIAVIGILAGIVVTAVNPQKNFIAANNAGRDVAVKTIRDAVYQYIIDTKTVPEDLDSTPRPICNPLHLNPQGCVDLNVLVDENYLTELPIDAAVLTGETQPETIGFDIAIDSDGMIVTTAPYYGQTQGESGGDSAPQFYVYWTSPSMGEIIRMKIGGTPEVILGPSAGIDLPYSIAVDESTNTLYWSDVFSQKIGKAAANGSGPSTFASLDYFPSAITLAGSLFWGHVGMGEPTPRFIVQSPTGTAAPTNVFGTSSVYGITAIAADDDYVYWTDSSAIYRVPIGGSQPKEQIADQPGAGPRGIAVDTDNDKIYWADQSVDTIFRADRDGQNVESVVDVGIGPPQGVTIDPVERKIYWVQIDPIAIGRADMDGWNQNVEIIWLGEDTYGLPDVIDYTPGLIDVARVTE